MSPACTVVIPLFNKQDEVKATISSVLGQSLTNFEIIIVDDGSTDDSLRIVKEFTDSRITVITQLNGGVSAARNTGIKFSKSELIAFIDADDLWHEDFLQAIIQLESDFPAASWYATGYEIWHHEKGNSTSKLNGVAADFHRGILVNYFDIAICSDPPVWSSAVAVKRDAIQSIGGFPVGIGSGEDLLTWARLAVRYTLAYEARSLSIFRVSGIERCADSDNKVGNALNALVNEFPFISNLKSYIGFWYRIQAVMAMRLGDHRLAQRYAWNAVRFGPRQMLNIYTLILTVMPLGLGFFVDKKVRYIFKSKL